MSKEMTPLEALDKIKQAEYFVDFELDAKVCEDYKKELGIIETALKDYENLKLKHKSMQDAVLDDFKKLKALEIIKNKNVEIKWVLGDKPFIDARYGLTDEEHDLLKEVFDE